MRVLIVEDEAIIAMTLEDMLRDLGHEVVGVAGTVRQALALLDGLDFRIDAAVVDANLGGASARPVIDVLEMHGAGVVLASGYEPGELARLGITVPAVRKPYRQDEVEKALTATARSGAD